MKRKKKWPSKINLTYIYYIVKIWAIDTIIDFNFQIPKTFSFFSIVKDKKNSKLPEN